MELKKLHPYFQLSLLEELYKAKIYEIDENKKKIEQDLIITNVCFFFLRRRGFSSGFTLSNAISPESILAVTIEDDKMVFTIEQENDSSNQQKKTFTSNENTKIIAIMKQVRWALFGDITINTNTDSLKDELQLNTMQYSSKNQNAERFLAHAINSNHSDLLSMAQSIFEMFSKENNSFTITHEIIKSSLINPFIQTLLSLRYFYEIIISNNQYSVFLDFISQILKQSKFLKKITFDNISFAKLNSNDTIFQGKDIEKSFSSIAFVNGCDFTSNQFLIFLRDFSSYTGNIESVVIKNCKFTSNTLPSFFDHINGVKSIKKVKYFEIDGLSSSDQIQEPLIRLLNNSNQFFHCIKVTNLPLDADVVLSRSTLFDNHVEEFHLHNSNFLKAIIPPIENYYSCNTIDLSRTKFKLESLISFFNNIKPPIRKIILNEINIDNKSLSEFYQQLPKYNFQFIEQFEFASNPVPSSYNQIFLDFISKMKNLAVLNISSSLDSSDSSVIENASNLLHSLKNLLLLIFKGSGKSSFKSEFTSIFDKLPPYLFYLDISGQNIGDDGMIKLAEFIVSRGKPNSQLQDIFEFKATQINHFLSNFEAKADGTLQYIIFNRMGCTIKGFISVLESIVGSDSAIKNAEWGQQEIYRLSKKDSSFEKNQLESRIQQLKNLFDDKFANNSKDPILSTSSFSTNSIIHFSLSSLPNQELNKKEKKKKREKDKEKKDDKERSKRKKRSKEKIEENENNEALCIEKERKERKRKEKKDSKDKVEVKDKTEEKEKREKKRKEKKELKDKNEVNEKVEETENGKTKRKEKRKPKEKANAEITDKTETKAKEKRKSDEKKIKKKKEKEDREEEKETKKDIKLEKEAKKSIKLEAENETKEKVEKKIKNELVNEVTNEIKEENENIKKNEVEEEKEKDDDIKNEDEDENEKDDEVEIKSEAENEKDDEVEINNEAENEKDNEIKNEVDKRIENEEAVDNDVKYDGIKIEEEEEDIESGNDEIEIEEEEEEKESEDENANEYEKEEQSDNEFEKESSDEEHDDRESLENKKEEEESSNKEKENDEKEEQETKNESEKEEVKKDDEFESIPPIVIKPKIDYRAIILDNSNQPFYDDLVECVGADSVSKCPLEDALNRLQKEAPFLLS
ncbi:hypothetical protein M9Y10_022882 [Tritrichomonas musculus]|uniref:Uncharacterized protein n=1 Tax=Tritrichomonas musculus TaxID=1915356 RepID=A0ABR2KTR4_9EUKA